MKRGGPLRRTRPLSRGKNLARVSARRAKGQDDRADVRDAVFARDGGCVLDRVHVNDPDVPRCFGVPMTPHHLRKASQGGTYDLDNLVTLCAGHQTWVEDEPNLAHLYGLVIRRGE